MDEKTWRYETFDKVLYRRAAGEPFEVVTIYGRLRDALGVPAYDVLPDGVEQHVITPVYDRDLFDRRGLPTRSARAGVRRRVLAALRAVASSVHTHVHRWDQGRELYNGGQYAVEGESRRYSSRWRTWGEYIENDPERMYMEARKLSELATALYDLADHVRAEAQAAQLARAERNPVRVVRNGVIQ